MVRKQLVERKIGVDKKIRWRGEEVSRLEGISDAIFGFSITLIVVSLEVPKTFDDLMASFSNIGAFAFSFLTLIGIWFVHSRFFRRYGLEDRRTAVLNTLLLFVVLLYVYPLKFLYTVAWREVIGTAADMIRSEQIPQLLVIYGLGYTTIYVIFGLMHYNAYRQRIQLTLTPLEVLNTIDMVVGNIAMCSIGLVSIAIAVLGSLDQVQWAGWVYATIPFVHAAVAWGMGRYHRQHPPDPTIKASSPPGA